MWIFYATPCGLVWLFDEVSYKATMIGIAMWFEIYSKENLVWHLQSYDYWYFLVVQNLFQVEFGLVLLLFMWVMEQGCGVRVLFFMFDVYICIQ